MTSLAAITDFRRSNHERSHSESSVWIDDFLNEGLNADELLDSHLRDDELNLLAPFDVGEDLQSALARFIPECAFSEFDCVEPVDIETAEAEQLFQSTISHEPPHEGSTEVPLDTTERQRDGNGNSQSSSQNAPPCDPVHSDRSGFAQPSLPPARCNKTPSPKKPPIATSPKKWLGAHPAAGDGRKSMKKGKSAPTGPTVDHGDKIKLEGVLVSSQHRGSPSRKNQKIVSQALLDRLKAASKRAARQSILISAPLTQQPARRCHISLDHDYCGDLTRGEKDDFEVQPMELEPEHERGAGRIEVLPDLSLAARGTKINQNSEVLDSEASARVEQHTEDERENHVFEVCGNVVNEEVVTSLEIGSASSDSGIESFVRPDGYDSEESSRRRWRDERSRKSRRSSPSSSDCNSVTSVESRRNVSRRKRKRSSSRRRSSRSRSPSPRKSYSAKRRRSYSRDSSPESNSGSEDRRSYGEKYSHAAGRGGNKVARRERKNIWAVAEKPRSFPQMPPLNKPGQKTIMQSALEEIERGGDRQVLYVGQIQEGTTRSYIREQFDRFGPIAEVSLHFRETGENYAFVTFHQPKDAYFALDNAALLPDFKLCFGGRRQFCGRKWSDLDNEQERAYLNSGSKDLAKKSDDFDSLLNQVKTASMRR